jgi:hypothetical protein
MQIIEHYRLICPVITENYLMVAIAANLLGLVDSWD